MMRRSWRVFGRGLVFYGRHSEEICFIRQQKNIAVKILCCNTKFKLNFMTFILWLLLLIIFALFLQLEVFKSRLLVFTQAGNVINIVRNYMGKHFGTSGGKSFEERRNKHTPINRSSCSRGEVLKTMLRELCWTVLISKICLSFYLIFMWLSDLKYSRWNFLKFEVLATNNGNTLLTTLVILNREY